MSVTQVSVVGVDLATGPGRDSLYPGSGVEIAPCKSLQACFYVNPGSVVYH